MRGRNRAEEGAGSRGREGHGVGQRRVVKKVASELGPGGQMDLGRWRHGGAWNSR